MKAGERQQQGRTGEGRTGINKKELCPACQVEYLENSYGNKKRKWVKIGKYCPNELCTYCRKDETRNSGRNRNGNNVFME